MTAFPLILAKGFGIQTFSATAQSITYLQHLAVFTFLRPLSLDQSIEKNYCVLWNGGVYIHIDP
jgi:hypothetical protein